MTESIVFVSLYFKESPFVCSYAYLLLMKFQCVNSRVYMVIPDCDLLSYKICLSYAHGVL